MPKVQSDSNFCRHPQEERDRGSVEYTDDGKCASSRDRDLCSSEDQTVKVQLEQLIIQPVSPARKRHKHSSDKDVARSNGSSGCGGSSTALNIIALGLFKSADSYFACQEPECETNVLADQ